MFTEILALPEGVSVTAAFTKLFTNDTVLSRLEVSPESRRYWHCDDSLKAKTQKDSLLEGFRLFGIQQHCAVPGLSTGSRQWDNSCEELISILHDSNVIGFG